MYRRIITIIIAVFLSFTSNIVFSAMTADTKQSVEKKSKTVEEKLKGQKLFLKYLEPFKIDIRPSAPQYKLPVSSDEALRYKKIFPHIENDKALELLAKNGFVVTVPKKKITQFKTMYSILKENQVPVFVTSDTVLHLYHILFDNLLKEIEEGEFYEDLMLMTKAMVRHFDYLYTADARAARPITKMTSVYRRNVAYFSVAAKLLDELYDAPFYVADDVAAELKLIKRHAGFSESPLFTYKEDYSQYVPRGHYTHSVKLENYFKAMMWYGRMTFLLKGKTDKIRDALISNDTARMQTRQALAITEAFSNNIKVRKKWERIYTVTAFFVGFSDDLTLNDYAANTPEETIKLLTYSDKMIDDLRRNLAALPSPAIYGGTGNVAVIRPVTEEDLDKALAATAGLRLLGQRFIPDSYAMGRLVGMAYTGKGDPFSKADTPIGPIRGFPRGLDVMSVLGSDRASEILKKTGDTEYVKYDEIVAILQDQVEKLDYEDWHMDLYWSWLAALKVLLEPVPSGYPTFMQTEAWRDRYLEESLASWAQFRHDTILYAKQSYGMVGSAAPGPRNKPKGYIEPSIKLYAELRSMNTMMLNGLTDFKLLSNTWTNRLQYVNSMLDRLISISGKELTGGKLDENELRFIEHFGSSLTSTIGELLPKSTTTAIIADVHTEPNSRSVVEVGTGTLNMIWVACPLGDGEYFICAGPVLSFYEFKQPMSDRLTDEKWQGILKQGKQPELDIFKKP